MCRVQRLGFRLWGFRVQGVRGGLFDFERRLNTYLKRRVSNKVLG